MNRAALLQYALRNGEWHSRRDIQEQVGYFLTNNAASELRKRGVAVEHRRDGRLDLYRLSDGVADESTGRSQSFPLVTATDPSVASPSEQLTFGAAA